MEHERLPGDDGARWNERKKLEHWKFIKYLPQALLVLNFSSGLFILHFIIHFGAVKLNEENSQNFSHSISRLVCVLVSFGYSLNFPLCGSLLLTNYTMILMMMIMMMKSFTAHHKFSNLRHLSSEITYIRWTQTTRSHNISHSLSLSTHCSVSLISKLLWLLSQGLCA